MTWHSDMADTREEFWRLINENLSADLVGIDIATFRIGASVNLLSFLQRIGSSMSSKPRILIGVGNPDATKNVTSGAQDPCLCYAEELVANKVADCRWIQDCHTKVWIFHRKAKKNTSVIVGGRNLNFSGWQDLSINLERGHPVIGPITKYFEHLWRQGADVVPDPLFLSAQNTRVF